LLTQEKKKKRKKNNNRRSGPSESIGGFRPSFPLPPFSGKGGRIKTLPRRKRRKRGGPAQALLCPRAKRRRRGVRRGEELASYLQNGKKKCLTMKRRGKGGERSEVQKKKGGDVGERGKGKGELLSRGEKSGKQGKRY